MNLLLRNIICLSICFLSAFVISSQSFTDPEDLADAVNASSNGGVFMVKNGSYNDFEATFEVMATADNPVIIKAETIGGVTLTGESFFVLRKSAHVTLEGFVFDARGEDSLVKLEGCNNIRISRNVFELETTESIKWVFVGGFWSDNTFPFEYPSHNNRLDHNIFKNKDTPGHYITIDGSFDNSGSEDVYYQSQYDRIDHNHFLNNGPRAVNEQESIRIGWSEMSLSSGFTVVEHNLFEDCDGDPEIVSVKSSDNIIRHNTFRKSYGTLSLRHGNRNRVEGNYFIGEDKPIGTSPDGATLYTGGIRIYGTDHVIVNNYMEGLNGTRWDAPIALTLGNAIDGQSSNLSKHFRAERVTIAYNTLVNNRNGIEIGFDNNGNFTKDLKDIRMSNNLITASENSLVTIVDTDNDQGDRISWSNNLMYPTASAIILEGATVTSFEDAEVMDQDPFLQFDENTNVWKATTTSPLFESTSGIDLIDIDIEGQERPLVSNPGADHYSLSSIRFAPLTDEDVGPNADVDLNTSINDVDQKYSTKIYPNPTNRYLNLKNLDTKFNRLEVLDSNGKLVFSKEFNALSARLDVTSLAKGVYYLRFSNSKKSFEIQKFIVIN